MDRRQHFAFWLNIALAAVLGLASVGARAQLLEGVDLLPVSEAFRLEVSRPQADRLRVSWTIAEGYYLYRHRFRFEAAPAKVRQGFQLPPGIAKQDPFFGQTEIYRHSLAFELPLEPGAATADRMRLRIVSQGCADIGICFLPEAREVELAVGESAVPEAGDPFTPGGAAGPADLVLPISPRTSEDSSTGRSP